MIQNPNFQTNPYIGTFKNIKDHLSGVASVADTRWSWAPKWRRMRTPPPSLSWSPPRMARWPELEELSRHLWEKYGKKPGEKTGEKRWPFFYWWWRNSFCKHQDSWIFFSGNPAIFETNRHGKTWISGPLPRVMNGWKSPSLREQFTDSNKGMISIQRTIYGYLF